jgi:selenocysteine lyase/cysteine desulfurase
MRVQTTAPLTDFRHEFAGFEGVTYLNGALQGPMPHVAARAAQEALEWKQHPYRLPDNIYFDLPNRIRKKIAGLIAAQPEEVAVTTGASSGMACVAAGIDWKPGDEVLVGRGEFPSHFATWLRYEQAGKLMIRIVEPRNAFIDAEDYLPHIGPKTRLVSASLVRFDNGVRLDAARIGKACEGAGAAFVLDMSQCAGAMKFDIRSLGATMAVSSGYKWMLGPYGTGFFWIANEWIERLPLGAVYFMALEGAHDFHKLHLAASGNRAAPGARRWDSAETANFTNLSAFNASLELIHRVGIETIEQHIDALVGEVIERLPRDLCKLASPEERRKRGPYVCISAKDPVNSAELWEKLHAARVHVSFRGTALRIAPHFYNTHADIDRFIEALES